MPSVVVGGVEEVQKKPSSVEKWKDYFVKQGLTPADLPLAIAAHEVTIFDCCDDAVFQESVSS